MIKWKFIKIVSFFALTQIIFNPALFAQGLDTDFFNQIKRQTGSTTDRTVVQSPIDDAREAEYLNQLDEQSKRKINAPPSIIENDFNSRIFKQDNTDERDLEQFGYSIFNRTPSMNQIMTGSIPDDYVLGVGDDLIISFKGSREEIISIKVDREGRLVIPSMNPIAASGLSLAEIRSVIKNNVAESLIGTEVFVSVATFRQISVLVAGEVENPSLVRISSLSSPMELLLQVGGVKKTGTLRNIIILRGNKKITVDLYNTIEGSQANITLLRDGDRLIVPTIGPTIAISGHVIRPGIYELPSGQESIPAKDVLELAGGTVRKNGNSYTHLRYDDTGKLNFERLNLLGSLSSSEIVIVNLLENSQGGGVTLSGHVKTPGIRSVGLYNNVKELIGSVKNLMEDPYLFFSVIERTDEITQTRNLIPFNLQKVLSGQKNIPLIEDDNVIIIGAEDIDFLRSQNVKRAIIGIPYQETRLSSDGELNSLFCEPIANLSKVIRSNSNGRFTIATRAFESERIPLQEEYNDLQEEVIRREEFLEVSQNNLVDDQVPPYEEPEVEKEEVFYNCPDIYKTTKNLLTLALENVASIDGSVRYPSVYPVADNMSVNSLITVAGGLLNDADLTRIQFVENTDSIRQLNVVSDWELLDSTNLDLNTKFIQPSGTVSVNALASQFESRPILISGEIANPGRYTIKKGERLSSLITRAGGLTEQAYPYGAVFTRESVKISQRLEMEKTAERLKTAMMSAAIKSNVESDSIVGLNAMISEMAQQEFIGRVVIEADPVVLNTLPDQDIVLQGGDTLFIPARSRFVITVGDVLNPSALQFSPGKGVAEYLSESGGFNISADEDRVFIVYPNGEAKPISLASWGGNRNLSVPPGTVIVVPNDLSPYDALSLTSEIGDIFRNLAVSAASIAVLVR